MKEVLCKICNVSAAFPYSVKEPFICISCFGTRTQIAFESNGAITENTASNVNQTDLQATPVTDVNLYKNNTFYCEADLARQLERSNISLQAKVSELNQELEKVKEERNRSGVEKRRKYLPICGDKRTDHLRFKGTSNQHKLAISTLKQIAEQPRNSLSRRLAISTLDFLKHVKPAT